jgi:hypothetical protein
MKAKRRPADTWTLRAAKDRFSEVVAAAEKRPQRIVRAGRSGAPAKEFVLTVAGAKRARKETLAGWLLASRGVLDAEGAKIMDEIVAARSLAKSDIPDFD